MSPSTPLVCEVVGWLCGNERFAGRIRIVEGARSLAHVMVVVPTAQSGRNLRLTLAREAAKRGWGGILPPRVVQPMQLVKPADATLREASPVEAAAAFQQYVKRNAQDVLSLDCLVVKEDFEDLTARFALFDQLQDIWRALAGRGFLMRDVPALAAERLAAELGDERRRWEQLAELERGYFGFLHDNGLIYPTEAVCQAKHQAAIVPEGVEEIVLPALADPVRVLGDVLVQQQAAGKRISVLIHASPEESDRFDEWGWPKTARWIGDERPVLDGLKDEDIVCAANASALAKIVAADYPPVEKRAEPPVLALCDGDLFQGVASAFLNRGYVVHNPERHLLVQSSLGRIIRDLIALYPDGEMPWNEFVAILRSDDVMGALDLTDERRARILAGLDVVQNAFIPNSIPRGFTFRRDVDLLEWQKQLMEEFCAVGVELEACLDAARCDASLVEFLRRMLKWTFASHRLQDGSTEREFVAAVDAAREYLNGLSGAFVTSLETSQAEFEALARRALDNVVYSLEPETSFALKTEGWLELSWSVGEQVSLTGFHEGKVPDSIIGHPFLPDSLRAALGLVTNDDRLARDTWILREVLASHAPGAVRAYVARTNDDGDICRPSRLLYLCSDAALARRIAGLFGDLPEARSDRSRRVEWPLCLPDVIRPPDRFSPSAIDTYVRCPFTYLLKYGLGMRPFEEKRELDAADFGSVVHAALKMYAVRQIKNGDDQLTDAAAIRALFREEILPVVRSQYGRTTLNLDLQLQAIEGRLSLFADAQAEWAAKGWRIRKAETPLGDYVPELGFEVRGVVDRLDENVNADVPRRWCVIDYKTWDKKTLTWHVCSSDNLGKNNSAHIEFAKRLGFALVRNKDGEERQRMLSVQLPVYGKALACKWNLPFADMQFCYFILGPTADASGLCRPLSVGQVEVSLATAKRAVELIRGNVFWPAGPMNDWKWDFGGLFVTDPTKDLEATEWAKRQAERLEALDVRG